MTPEEMDCLSILHSHKCANNKKEQAKWVTTLGVTKGLSDEDLQWQIDAFPVKGWETRGGPDQQFEGWSPSSLLLVIREGERGGRDSSGEKKQARERERKR